jgi:hypothetical protein
MIMRRVVLCLACLGVLATRAGAQRIALETLTDVELWKTSDSSRLLARNNGDALAEARLQGWFRMRFGESLELRTLGRLGWTTEPGTHLVAALEQASLRYVRSRELVVEAGKLLYPMGSFGARRFSNTNPVIGSPDLYPYQYPIGVVVSGVSGALDYRAGLVTLPLVNTKYTPEPGASVRPVLGFGWSAGPQLRLGASATRGPYLSDRVDGQLPAGAAWSDFDQAVIATEARYSAGYFEARAEAAWSRYQVPVREMDVSGFGWYGEVRGTISPRLFVAARYEDFDYPFILPVSRAFWVATATRQMNGELGVGYRVSADALIKASLRKDNWPVQTTASGARFPNGYALGIQFSLHTDLIALFEGKY